MKVGVILGSDSDWPLLSPGVELLQNMGVGVEVLVASAHRTPDKVRHFAEGARARQIGVIIAAAGLAAHLPGVVASYTTLPVLGVPVDCSGFSGMDALLSIVQMPPGIPVGTMSVDGGKNAALFALEILAVTDEKLAGKLADYRTAMAAQVTEKNERLQEKLSLSCGGDGEK